MTEPEKAEPQSEHELIADAILSGEFASWRELIQDVEMQSLFQTVTEEQRKKIEMYRKAQEVEPTRELYERWKLLGKGREGQYEDFCRFVSWTKKKDPGKLLLHVALWKLSCSSGVEAVEPALKQYEAACRKKMNEIMSGEFGRLLRSTEEKLLQRLRKEGDEYEL
jgi:hypothetical protein